MPYIWIALFVSGFASGFWAGYEIQAEKVSRMETYRLAQDALAKTMLEAKANEVKQAELMAKEVNDELDKANLQAVGTINAYHDKLAAIRMHDRPVKGCRDPVPKSASPGVLEAASDDGQQLSEGIAGFFVTESLRADLIRNYAISCSKFIDQIGQK